jgi:hypothetical protein
MSELIGDLADFGRRNPPAFLGAAALAGFALARFGIASERSSAADQGGRHG